MALKLGTSTVQRAAAGVLPPWARVGAARRAHIERVAALMDGWARTLALPDEERARWRAAAWLHDALRDAEEPELRAILAGEGADLALPLLHGPAAACILESEGESDLWLLLAIRYHTVGHPDLDAAGRALYLADFLEPGRDFEVAWRRSLAERMPDEMDAVLREVVEARVERLVRLGRPIRPETLGFLAAVRAAPA